MTIVVAVDAEAAVRAWATGLNIRAALAPLRSGAAYLLLSRAGGTQDTPGVDHARITAIGHGSTKQQAANVALAFANAVWNLTPGVIADGVFCLGAEVESGPTELADPSGVSRYLVVASFELGPTR
ncbi:MAG: hypothetical protein JO222_09290 [Frankiales bacterium]|nr:hypothetical protein [Frankiales bacterium]